MALTSRQKLLDRNANTRDAKIFIIATEGAETEKKYFETFNTTRPFERSRVRVQILPPQQDRSAPQHTLKQLESYLQTQDLDSRDEVWLVLDVDTWPEHTLAKVCATAKRKGFDVAVSHPCFEVWYCLHFAECDYETLSQHAQGRDGAQKLKRLWRGYLPPSATKIELAVLRPKTPDACRRARDIDKGDIDAARPWPPSPGTRIYQLVESILKMLED